MPKASMDDALLGRLSLGCNCLLAGIVIAGCHSEAVLNDKVQKSCVSHEERNILDALRDDSLEIRERATRLLLDMGDKALPVLEAALYDSSAEVRTRAEQVKEALEVRRRLPEGVLAHMPGLDVYLAAGGDPAYAAALWKILTSHFSTATVPVAARRFMAAYMAPRALRGAGSAGEKIALVQALRRAGLFPAERGLVLLLSDDDAETRKLALEDLSELYAWDDCTAVIREALKRLEDADAEVRVAALGVLQRSNSSESIPAVTTCLDDSHADVRRAAIVALCYMRAQPAVPAIVTKMHDPAAVVRQEAVSALSKLGAREYASDLCAALRDSECMVRREAISALAALRMRSHLPLIRDCLQDADEGVRFFATGTFGRLADRKYAAAVAPMLGDISPSVRSAALDALGRMGAADYVHEIRLCLEDGDEAVSCSAMWALMLLHATEAKAEVAGKLKSETAIVRAAAAAVLGRFDAREYTAAIASLLQDEDAGVRQEAVLAIARLSGEDSATHILDRLNDTDCDVRRAAVQALLLQGGTTPPIAALRKMLHDPESRVREAVVTAFGKLDIKEAVPEIADLLATDNSGVRRSAMAALCRLGHRKTIPVVLGAWDTGVLYNLNSLRVPGIWNRLEALSVRLPIQMDSEQDIISEAASCAHMPIVWRCADPPANPLWLNDLERSLWNKEEICAIDFLVLLCEFRKVEFVIDRDRITFLSRQDAHALWSTWWCDAKSQK